MAREDVLAVVADQFDDIRKRLDIQIVRTGELQAQLDAQRKEMSTVRQQVELVTTLVKDLIAKEP